jgi:hypothetical protein
MLRAIVDSFPAFCARFGVRLWDWQQEAFGAAVRREPRRFVYRLAGISVPRGDGKSFGAAAVGVWRLVTGPPPQEILSTALDKDGARVTLRHARSIIRQHRELAASVEILANGFVVPATGSLWTITSREHTASRGRHPDLVLYDESGWAQDDELFSSLLAGQASVLDPLMLLTSTVGRRQAGPLWTTKVLAEGGDPEVFWSWCGQNRSPRVTDAFLERQRRILLPAQYAREHSNQWVDQADGFTTPAEVDAAMGHGWTEQLEGRRDTQYVGYTDLGAVHDPSVIAVGHEDGGTVYIDKVLTFQGSHEQPVSLAAVEEAIADLCRTFRLRRMRVESWQGLAAVQSLQRRGLPVEIFAPTAKTNAEEWPILAQRLSSRTLVLPPHARLREELLNLFVEVGPHGVRVVDRGRVHQDHAVAVRGVVAGLQRRTGPLHFVPITGT